MSNKKDIILANIKAEIDKIENKKNRIYFFVIDTKGAPSGSLEYIYNLALILKEDGYNVSMLHTEDEFVGVESWLGKEYAELPHFNVNKGDIGTSPSDILFIPEIFSQVMNQTRNLPCKRIAILQNYDYVIEQMPYSAQWGDFKILEGITNSDYQAIKLKEVFPYVKLTKISPFVSDKFGTTDEPKKMVVNVICKDQGDIKKIVKPFYWKYPMFKWVSFKELRNINKDDFAKALREAAITIVVDDTASVCYNALEAMKSGSIVMCKIPSTELDWATSEDETMPNCCVWFNDFSTLHKQIASVVRSWITDKVPNVLKEESEKTLSQFSREKTKNEIIDFVGSVLEKRKNDMTELMTQVNSGEING